MNSQQGDYSALKTWPFEWANFTHFFQNHFIHYWILIKLTITFMLVTDVGDSLRWQFWDVGDRCWQRKFTNDSAIKISKMSPSWSYQHIDVTKLSFYVKCWYSVNRGRWNFKWKILIKSKELRSFEVLSLAVHTVSLFYNGQKANVDKMAFKHGRKVDKFWCLSKVIALHLGKIDNLTLFDPVRYWTRLNQDSRT